MTAQISLAPNWARTVALSAATTLVAVFALSPAANAGDLGGEEYIEQGAYDFDDNEDRDDGRRYARHDNDDYDDDNDNEENDNDDDDNARDSFKDGQYLRPYRRAPRFSENNDRGGCVPRHVIKHNLKAQGWRDFRHPEPRGNVVLVSARRPSGQLHRVTVDRCSGRIIEARIVDEVPPEALAERRHNRQYRTY